MTCSESQKEVSHRDSTPSKATGGRHNDDETATMSTILLAATGTMILRRLTLLLALVLCSSVETVEAAFHSRQFASRKAPISKRCSTLLALMTSSESNNLSSDTHTRSSQSRFHFLVQSTVFSGALVVPTLPAFAFDGGVGGLGKTKPDTGIVFWGESMPLQNQQGIVSAELNVGGDVVLVEFTTPWPLLPTTSGLEARNLQSSESAFVSILPNTGSSDKQLKQAVLDTILGSQGKFGKSCETLLQFWSYLCF